MKTVARCGRTRCALRVTGSELRVAGNELRDASSELRVRRCAPAGCGAQLLKVDLRRLMCCQIFSKFSVHLCRVVE